MYKCLIRSSIRVKPHPLRTWGEELFCLLTSDALPYTRGIRILRLLGVKKYLNNYFAMYKRLTLSRIRVDSHPSPTWR